MSVESSTVVAPKTGIWIIGAYGGVATTVAVGLSALKNGAVGNWGLVSQLPHFRDLELIDWSDLVLGGHEIRKTSSLEQAKLLTQGTPVISADLVSSSMADLERLDQSVRPGVLINAGSTISSLATEGYVNSFDTPRLAIEQIKLDLEEFRSVNALDNIIVVNLASTEPAADRDAFPSGWLELNQMLSQPDCPLPFSSIYAIAAMEASCAYVNFTPSLGSDLPATKELAMKMKVCHAGCDGKTGETFLKSVLAPAFGQRNLEVMSWVGHNIFGNMDGVVLNDPQNKQTKITSKDQLLGQILGYPPQTHVSIEYIQSLGDWKTAWDHIHFRGFLGTPMIMTFTWQGCDSILAAPLVLDLVRFTERAQRAGQCGILSFLSSFFKSPLDQNQHDFSRQFQQLLDWAVECHRD